jgi:fructose-bisphosphate aldolase class 1
MFTGLGKGIYKIADKEASAGQIVEGMLDVGLSFIGGSKVIVKGSQAMGASKDIAKRSAQKAFNYLQQMAKNLEKTELKTVTSELLKNSKLTPSQVASLITTSLEMEGKQAVATQLKVVSAELNKKFTDMLKQGVKGIYGNMTDDAAKSFKEFVKLNMESSLK